MGPNLLIDKSTLQSLSKNEIDFLCKHYSVVLPPVLIVEVIADYAKYRDAKEAGAKVGILANKLDDDYKVNIDYRHLTAGELIGQRFPMDGRPILEAAGVGYTLDGEKSVLVEDSPWQVAAQHWQAGRFTEEDIQFAYQYRAERDAVNIAEMAEELAKEADLPKFKNLDEVVGFIQEAVTYPDAEFQGEALRAWLNFQGFSESFSKRVMDRWEGAGRPSFRAFAPYGFFCYSVMSVVAVAMVQGLVPTGKDSHLLIDVEYLFYLPFCQVFCSSDKFHRGLSSTFMRTKQVFIEGKDLKVDLHNIFEHWIGLNEIQRREFAMTHRHRPPRLEASVTCQCWDRFMNPNYPKGDVKLSEEKETALLKKLHEAISAAEQNKKNAGEPEYRLFIRGNGPNR